jgi:hypothetical protein
MSKALVLGIVGYESHEESVRSYFLVQSPTWDCHIAEIGSGIPAGNIVTYQANVADCVSYAITNGYNIIIRSYTGLWAYKLEWDTAVAAGIVVAHAHGSNSHVELSSPPYIGSAMACGGGVTTNERSYGPGIEFYDCTLSEDTEESWATAVVAGKLANILDALVCTIQEARYRAQLTASENGIWDNNDGFGRIDVAAAIAYVPTVPLPNRRQVLRMFLP